MNKQETILKEEKWNGFIIKNVPWIQEYFVIKDIKTEEFKWTKGYCYIGSRELMSLSKCADYMEENGIKEIEYNEWEQMNHE